MSEASPMRPESFRRLRMLEENSEKLSEQLTGLTVALEQLQELREQAAATHTQAELAVVTSLDATNEIADTINPQLLEMRKRMVFKHDLRRRLAQSVLWGLAAVLVFSYVVVSGQQVFSKYCAYPMYLTQERAQICNQVFIGDRHYYPGPQYSNKNPGLAPGTSMEGTVNG